MNPSEPSPSETRQNETPENETPPPPTPEPPRPPPPVTPRLKIKPKVIHAPHLRSKTPFFKTIGNKIKSIFHKRRKLTEKTRVINEVTKKSLYDVSDRSIREALSPGNLEQSSNIQFSTMKTDRITLYQELRLVERQDKEINAAWKGAHLILFFLTFVFGSFCTFCFHVLMYMFDEKCVLSPKMVALKDEKRNKPTGILIDYIAAKDYKSMPVQFVTTIWVDKTYCYLPTYVPLFSGICGLIWTTMFMMSSSGTHTLSGLHRPWRVVPAVFIFSTMMSILCIYTSFITHTGLLNLCYTLADMFGSDTCSYTINIATISYERRIRGVYQATRLTMAAAWLHTLCWVSAALLALARMLLIIDFCLVRVRADLIGNIELMLERHEELIRTNEYWNEADTAVSKQKSPESIKVHFHNKDFGTESEAKSVKNESNEDKLTTDSAQFVDSQRPRSLLKRYEEITKLTKSSSENSISTDNIEQNKVNHSESEKTLTYRRDSDDTLKNTTNDEDVSKSDTKATEHSITLGIVDQWMPMLKEKLSTLKSYIQSASETLAPLERSVPNAKEQMNENDTKGGEKNVSPFTPLHSYDPSTPGPSQPKDNSTPLQPYDPSTPGSSQTIVDLFHKDDPATSSASSSQKKEKKKEKQD